VNRRRWVALLAAGALVAGAAFIVIGTSAVVGRHGRWLAAVGRRLGRPVTAERVGVALMRGIGVDLRGIRIGDVGLSIVEAILVCEPEPASPPWRPLAEPPDDVADLCGRWWWMAEEIEAHWDAAGDVLVLTEPGQPEWRFAREGTDQWRGIAGEQVGEVLRVRRGADGSAVALDIATFVYTRDAGVYTP